MTASGPVAESGGGVLHSVNVNTGASGATVTLQDGTSTGPVIAVIDASAVHTFLYDAVLSAGLYAAVSGSPDVTIVIVPSARYTA